MKSIAYLVFSFTILTIVQFIPYAVASNTNSNQYIPPTLMDTNITSPDQTAPPEKVPAIVYMVVLGAVACGGISIAILKMMK